MPVHTGDVRRPVQEFTVGNIPGSRVAVVAQQGFSGTWWAWTKEPHPCPGEQPEKLWGCGKTAAEAVHQVAESVKLLNRMNCIAGQTDWRIWL
jgi:hypothetical protein